MGEELCNAGKVLNEKCDLLVYSRIVGTQQIGSLSQEDRDLLTLWTKCTFDVLSDICIHHENKYIGRYQATQRYCVNPFNWPGIKISKDLRNVDEELALFLNILPGQTLCKRCKETAKENMKAAKKDCENNKDDQDSSYLSKDFDRSRFNSSAEALGFSPIKPVGKRDAVSYAQNKAKRMRTGLNEKLANVMEILNKKLNESSLNDCTNCKDLERLIVLIKEKLEISSPRDQIKILTLTPESWSIKKTVQDFGVTEYKVKCARELKKERGILTEPKLKVGKALSGDVSEKAIFINKVSIQNIILKWKTLYL